MSEYSVILGIGASLGLLRVAQLAPAQRVSSWVSAGLGTLGGVLLSSRLVFVLFHYSHYREHPLEAFLLNAGGLSLSGALLGFAIAVLVVSAVLRLPLVTTLDRLSPLIIPLAVSGWLGCWLSGCAYGALAEDERWFKLLAPDEANIVAARFPLQALAVAFLIVISLAVERLKLRLESGMTGAMSLLGLSLNLLFFLPLRADPTPTWGKLQPDLWAASALLAASLTCFLIAGMEQIKTLRQNQKSEILSILLKRIRNQTKLRGDAMSDLSLDVENTRQAIVSFIRETVSSAGYSKAVIGLSGGIDSALSCWLAVEALGKENVLAIRMPYKTSSESSLEDAQTLIDLLEIESLTLPITEMVDAWIEKFPQMSPIRKGNIMARCRMITLYDQSAAHEALVVGTGNKTEALLGYTTLYGDSACAFNPIGDLYKTQVRQMAREFGIPDSIIDKPPSADLWQGQTDEGELGFTYEQVDKLLYLLVNVRLSDDECIARGFDPEFVHKVIKIIRQTRFKRTMPPIAYLDPDSAGYGFVNDPAW